MFSILRFATKTLAQTRTPRRDPTTAEETGRHRLRELVKYAFAHSDFYRKRYDGVNVDRFELAELPPVTKAELMAEFDEVVTDKQITHESVQAFLSEPNNLGQYFANRYVLSHTSGTQGRPMVIAQHRNQLDLLFALQFARGNVDFKGSIGEAWQRLRDPFRLAVVTMRPGFYPSAVAFTYMPKAARTFAKLLHLRFDDPDLIEKLHDFRPNGLTAYASVLTDLAIHSAKLQLGPELRQITNISEGLGEVSRQQVEAAFGVPVLDTYAMGECPFLSSGCPMEGAHVNTDWAILEVVDEQYRPVRPGETGSKVLVTNLANFVQPIIRYEIGDMIEMATEPCPCGNRLPKISRIGGRSTEALWLWDGSHHRRVLLNAFKCACEYLHDVREWQVQQTQPNRIKVLLEPLPKANPQKRNAAKRLRERLGFFGLPRNTHVDVEYVDHLMPDSETGKFKHLLGLKRADPNQMVS